MFLVGFRVQKNVTQIFSYLDQFYSSTLAILLHFFHNNVYRSHVQIF